MHQTPPRLLHLKALFRKGFLFFFLLNFIDNTQTVHKIKYRKKEREKKIVAKITIYCFIILYLHTIKIYFLINH